MSGEIKINRIKSRHHTELAFLGDVIKTAQERIPKLRATAAHRIQARNMAENLSTLGAHVRANGFDPTRTIQHVANYDTEIWTLILDSFAKYDPDTGELMDDGLLYRWDPNSGNLKLSKDFFYALLDFFESAGISCDMRGKIKLN